MDTNVIESSLRSRLGARYKILSNVHTNRFRFGISVPLYLEYEHRVEELFHSGIVQISEKAKNAILKALAFYADEVPIYYKIIRYETMHFFAERAKDFSEQDFLDALQEIPAVEAEEHDKMPSFAPKGSGR